MTYATDPSVWAILCYREGDNAQILALAEALGLPFEVKRLCYRPGGRLIDVWRGANLHGICRKHSSSLGGPPWPDLVISASMRNEPVCRWIRRQSGERTRYVHIGKPWGMLEGFDLVITMPEYPVPDAPNVLRTRLSMHRLTPERLTEAARSWQPRFAHLPWPWIGVLAGGYGGPYPFDPDNARCLGREASEMARRLGGSLLVTTSARTSRRASAALQRAIDVPYYFHDWQSRQENPYFGFLALASRFIVTCDSASMLAEACATGKHVYMFDLVRPSVTSLCFLEPDQVRAFLYRKVMWGFAPKYLTRDIRIVHRFLLNSGRVVRHGEKFTREPPPPLDERLLVVFRTHELLGIS
jgi:mitochondrial fission protein ELM1